jgi:hypothetical protein
LFPFDEEDQVNDSDTLVEHFELFSEKIGERLEFFFTYFFSEKAGEKCKSIFTFFTSFLF